MRNGRLMYFILKELLGPTTWLWNELPNWRKKSWSTVLAHESSPDIDTLTYQVYYNRAFFIEKIWFQNIHSLRDTNPVYYVNADLKLYMNIMPWQLLFRVSHLIFQFVHAKTGQESTISIQQSIPSSYYFNAKIVFQVIYISIQKFKLLRFIHKSRLSNSNYISIQN